MAIKFRRRLRVFPGFYLNLSKSGMSATVGMRGLNVNIGKKGTFLNTGIPGTGIYDRVKLNSKQDKEIIIPDNTDQPELSTIPEDAVEIKSYQPELITSEGLFGLKESIINAQIVKEELRQESHRLAFKKVSSLFLLTVSYLLIFGIFIKWLKENYISARDASREAKETYQNFKLDIEFNMDRSILNDYLTMKKNFEQLMNINVIWDITSAKSVDRVKERSAAGTSITRTKVKFSKSSLDYINTEYEAIRFQNANAGDLFIYPGFIVMIDKQNKEFGLIDFREISIEHHGQRFVETDGVPNDSKIVDRTWKYVNKNGSPDKRYKDNHEIPIALYYEMTLSTKKGLFESYHFSNPEIGQIFCDSFNTYKESLQKMKWGREDNTMIEENLHA
jgi:hypothetical protein